MYNIEIIKETFKRKNSTENKIMCNIIDKFNGDITLIKSSDIPNVDWCRNELKGKNILILDAKNPNQTNKGNSHITEFCLILKSGELVWIDGKQLKAQSNYNDMITGDMHRASNCRGKFWYVCEGVGYSDKTIRFYNEYAEQYGFKIEAFNIKLLTEKLQSL